VLVRPATAGDEADWRSLWAGYCDFYRTVVPAAVTHATWRRILDPAEEIDALLAIRRGETVGLANYVLHPFTWGKQRVCLLEDLYVLPEARGFGIGRRLIEHLLAKGRDKGWARIYWHTHESNATARRLYDCFVPADGFIRYTIRLHDPTAPVAIENVIEDMGSS
jgi:GNAT superfamily N-acetyltransferase